MLYIKIDPFDRVTHYNTSSQKIGVSGPLKKFEGLLTYYISKLIPVIGGPLKCEFVKFEGLLACYISKLVPINRETHCHTLYQKTGRPGAHQPP